MPRRTPVLCVNVDIDGLTLYRRIHGLPEPPPAADGAAPAELAWTVGVPRFLDLFEELGLRATFFCVADDLRDERAAAVAREALARGHGLANHSLTHPYDLVRLPLDEQRRELREADALLRTIAGGPIAGFRAPGYNMSPALRAELVAMGYRYDSSAFPCPAYVAAKTAAITLKRLQGRHSRSIVTRPWEVFGALGPHRVRTPHGPLWSLPISVLRGVRFPLIGTSLTMLGPNGAAALAPVAAHQPWLNLEFHAVDLMALDEDGLPAELEVQPDLRVPVARKRETYVRFLRRAGRAHTPLTLAECAAAV